MEKVLKFLSIMTIAMHCNGEINLDDLNRYLTRRSFFFDNEDAGTILGIPDGRSKLPPGEPILPGHTLIRPSFGMLKSAVKFPHKDHEDGAGVYGNLKKLGLRYGGFSDRVLYTKFRRMLSDNYETDSYTPALRLLKIKSNQLPTNILKRIDEDDDRHYSNELWHSFETTNQPKVHPTQKDKLKPLNSNKKNKKFSEWYSQAKILKGSDDDDDRNYSNELWHSFETPNHSGIPMKKDKLKALDSDKEIDKFFDWYFETKELYDHIKFNRDALSFSDLLKEKPVKKQITLDEFRQSFYRRKKNKNNKIYHY